MEDGMEKTSGVWHGLELDGKLAIGKLEGGGFMAGILPLRVI